MKNLVIIFTFLFLASCGDDRPYVACDDIKADRLQNDLKINQLITDPLIANLFQDIEPSTNFSRGKCVETYSFRQYKPINPGFCYFVDIQVDCYTDKIISIYEIQ